MDSKGSRSNSIKIVMDIIELKEELKTKLPPIWFYWDGGINVDRLRILQDCIYSTRVFNPDNPIYLVSNSIDQSQIESKFNIKVITWNNSFFSDLPIPEAKIEKYKLASPRDFSDLFRLVLLYQFGGSYVDTDDLGIGPIKSPINTVCRSYDPHTSFYNKIEAEGCVPGFTREIRGYDHIPMFPRNDCWQNWNPNSEFILSMLNNSKFQKNEDVVWIGGDFSWQSIANETCLKFLSEIKISWNFGLTLMYLFEDFVAHSSVWDRCAKGGEMCDIWTKLPKLEDYKWGEYKCDKETGLSFYNEVMNKYPYVSHLWLHSKNDKKEWLIEINEQELYSVSTWIYHFTKEKINGWG